MNWLKGFLSGPDGEASSKRLLGIATIISGIVMGFQGNSQGVLFVGAGAALLAVNGITKT